MRWKPRDAAERGALSLSGLALLASAGLAARMALQHMPSAAALCGAGPVAHCAWCVAAVALGLAGATALVFALQPRAEPAYSRRSGAASLSRRGDVRSRTPRAP